MRDPLRANGIGERCDALDKRVEYAERQIHDKNDTVAGRLLIANALSAVSRVLKAVSDQFGRGVVTCTVGAGDRAAARKDFALDICESLLAAGDAQVGAVLASLPPFTLPIRRRGAGGLASFGSNEDPSLPRARRRIVEDAEVITAFVEQTRPFGNDTPPARFLATLLSSDLSGPENIDRTVEAAFVATENG